MGSHAGGRVDSTDMRRHWKLIVGLVVAIVVALGAIGYLWLNNLAEPMPEAGPALVSDDQVTVTTEPWLTFTPATPTATGLIFYPGGRVPPEAYAPPVRAAAEAGYLSVIPDMPFGLAVLSPDAADAVIEAHPEIEHWVIGGHSLGGAMAGQYVAGHDEIDGLVLWAAYPPGGSDLSASDQLVSSIYATNDGLTTLDEIEASRAQLPAGATYVEIEGGNHAQFGWYGEQDGDGVAEISREAQQAQAVAATVQLLEDVSTQ
jgi:pimeloyl-ACP methyl ester carboxylesterase